MTRIADKIFMSVQEAIDVVDTWKKEGQKLVFTNGCFDIIHVGHVLYLEEARRLGDKLIVGINSDASVTKLKGSSRPIKDIFDRSHVLAALQDIDMVIVFEEDTPLEMIKNIVPDVLVKGGDWKPQDIVGSDIVLNAGGCVKNLSFIDGYSTTRIENRIKTAG